MSMEEDHKANDRSESRLPIRYAICIDREQLERFQSDQDDDVHPM